jgi:hypothetical protein
MSVRTAQYHRHAYNRFTRMAELGVEEAQTLRDQGDAMGASVASMQALTDTTVALKHLHEAKALEEEGPRLVLLDGGRA